MISANAGPNNPKAPRSIAGNVKTFQSNNITHIQKNHEIPRARAKNFQGFAFEILALILTPDNMPYYICPEMDTNWSKKSKLPEIIGSEN